MNSSSTSSIYGSRNVLSGLASGLDTESMIENSIQGYKLKIKNLQNDQTKLTWKQDAYRSITDKLIALKEKYTSYASKTNLSSVGFFNKAVTTTTGGKNADKVSATGKTSSEVQINAVQQLATAARYSVSASKLGAGGQTAAGGAMKLDETMDVSNLSGDLTIKWGNNRSVSLSFGEDEVYKDAGEFVEAINAKLAEQDVVTSKGVSKKGSEVITARLDGDEIVFDVNDSAGDSAWIGAASGKLQKTLNIKSGSTLSDSPDKTIRVPAGKELYTTKDALEYLKDKSISVTLDGVTKKVKLGDLTPEDGKTMEDKLLENLQQGLKDAFGSKVTVEKNAEGGLSFTTTSQNSSLKVTSDAAKALGFGTGSITNYLDTGTTLKDIKVNGVSLLDGMKALEAVGKVKADSKGVYHDEAGNTVAKLGEGDDAPWVRVDNNNKVLYSMEINGKRVGTFTEDSALDSVITAINSSDAGVKVSYSKMTNKFTFNATETGSQGRIDFGDEDSLAFKLFGSGKRTAQMTSDDGTVQNTGLLADANGNAIAMKDTDGSTYYVKVTKGGKYLKTPYINGQPGSGRPVELTDDELKEAMSKAGMEGYTAGTDAILSATVNGEEITLTRSSNVVDIDGLSVTLKGTFNDKDADGNSYFQEVNGKLTFTGEGKIDTDSPVTFTTKANADDLVKVISEFVEEYNDLMKTAHDAYTTTPAGLGKSTAYEPLSDEEKADLSESEIKTYEEKAKQGILFGNSDISRAYDSLRKVIAVYGDDRKAMEAIGLTTSYKDGVTTLSLDEDQLRAALETNPDAVQKVFTQSKENGAESDGLMARMSKTIKTYASTSIGAYGVLVKAAGTKTSALTLMDNTTQKQIDRIDKEIERWQTRMSDKIDYYTRQFTALEQLMAQFNSQSSTLAGMMGG